MKKILFLAVPSRCQYDELSILDEIYLSSTSFDDALSEFKRRALLPDDDEKSIDADDYQIVIRVE